jgi:hypothetical protein
MGQLPDALNRNAHVIVEPAWVKRPPVGVDRRCARNHIQLLITPEESDGLAR